MRAREQLVPEPFPAYVARLSKVHGLKALGAGMFSKVFQHPTLPSVVVKVVCSKDRNYLQYLHWASKRQDNPYVPRLYDIFTYGQGCNRYSIIFMEKLRAVPHSRLWPKLDKLFAQRDVLDWLDPDAPGTVRKLLRRTIRTTNDENLREVCKYVLEHHGSNTDMHHGNFMLRGSQVVFTDPVMSHFEYEGDDFPAPFWVSKEHK